MNPKDMTNKELVKNHAEARAFAENSDYDLARNGALRVSEDCAAELLRRLNEADALRKENESLKYCLLNTKNDLNTIMRQLVGREEYWPIQRSLKFTRQQIEFVLNPIKNTKESEANHD